MASDVSPSVRTGQPHVYIGEVTAPPSSRDVFAAAATDGTVTVRSLASRAPVAELRTVYEFGGRRLALDERTGLRIYAAGYDVAALACYLEDGETAWRRTDLRRVQQLGVLRDGALAVSRDRKPVSIVDGASGETIGTVETEVIYGNRNSSTAIGVQRADHARLTFYDLDGPNAQWTKEATSFAILDVAFSADSILMSESGGPLSCYDLSGDILWEWSPPPGTHAIRVDYLTRHDQWSAVLMGYEERVAHLLVNLDDDGVLTAATEIGHALDYAFFDEGERLVTSDGQVLSVLDGTVVWDFASRSKSH